jgi:hypothetical protein
MQDQEHRDPTASVRHVVKGLKGSGGDGIEDAASTEPGSRAVREVSGDHAAVGMGVLFAVMFVPPTAFPKWHRECGCRCRRLRCQPAWGPVPALVIYCKLAAGHSGDHAAWPGVWLFGHRDGWMRVEFRDPGWLGWDVGALPAVEPPGSDFGAPQRPHTNSARPLPPLKPPPTASGPRRPPVHQPPV